MMIRWMTVLMAALGPAAAEERALFNGKDLAGWTGVDRFWTVEDGAVTARHPGHTRPSRTAF